MKGGHGPLNTGYILTLRSHLLFKDCGNRIVVCSLKVSLAFCTAPFMMEIAFWYPIGAAEPEKQDKTGQT